MKVRDGSGVGVPQNAARVTLLLLHICSTLFDVLNVDLAIGDVQRANHLHLFAFESGDRFLVNIQLIPAFLVFVSQDEPTPIHPDGPGEDFGFSLIIRLSVDR